MSVEYTLASDLAEKLRCVFVSRRKGLGGIASVLMLGLTVKIASSLLTKVAMDLLSSNAAIELSQSTARTGVCHTDESFLAARHAQTMKKMV